MAKKELLPFLAMVIVQVGYGGMNICSKAAMESGMNPLILVAYRQLFATIAIVPFAYFFERAKRPKITKQVLIQIFFCSLFGATLNQILYFVGLNVTSATIASALYNLLPAMTFILAIPFGLEAVEIRKRGVQAKILGTLICVSGAMLLSFYHGILIHIPQPNIHWQFADSHQNTNTSMKHLKLFFGTLILLASNLALAIWYILQAKMSENFTAPYTSSALMCFMATIQCMAIAACTKHNISDWSLNSRIRIVASIYAGVLGSAVAFFLITWTIQRKGPLYVSMFSPLMLVVAAMLSWILQMEKLYIGTGIGSALIILGLYAVLWGKNRETINDNIIQMDKTGIELEESKHMPKPEHAEILENEDLEKHKQIVDFKGN
ncbi:WAT1-related protein At1g09380-like [Amaranthus tricolor]|uniref:WAT1-related protein At1g09380-like n=1 Tax=Amaranthus tricolor TaxID=29722 RepID=UPI002590F889|nr:WAT1-related protein At1g09380-like [Amaranthus tricolor]